MKNNGASVATLSAEVFEKVQLEAIRSKLIHSEEQADRGEYIESNLESMLKRLNEKR